MIFILILVVICVWLFGQFASAIGATIALCGIALSLIIALLNKFMDSKYSTRLSVWIGKDPKHKYIVISIIIIIPILIGILLGASELSAYDITWEYASWTTKESFLGMEYDEHHNGVLVTNNSNKTVTVCMKADFYDKNKNWLDDDTNNWTGAIAPGNSNFIEITPDNDDVYYIEYSLQEQKRVKYIPLSAGFDTSCDVVFEIDEENNDFIIKNNTNYEIESCGCEFIFYDSKGEIIFYDSVGKGDIPARKQVSTHFTLEEPSIPYEKYDVIFYAFRKK